MSNEYKLVYDGGIHQLSEGRALTVEVQENSKGVKQLKIWSLYDDNGNWSYCGANGGRGIILPLKSVEDVKFIAENMVKVLDLVKKIPDLSGEVKKSTASGNVKMTVATPTPTTPPTKTPPVVTAGDKEITLTPEILLQYAQAMGIQIPQEPSKTKNVKGKMTK